MAKLIMLKKGEKSHKWKPWHKRPVRYWKYLTFLSIFVNICLISYIVANK